MPKNKVVLQTQQKTARAGVSKGRQTHNKTNTHYINGHADATQKKNRFLPQVTTNTKHLRIQSLHSPLVLWCLPFFTIVLCEWVRGVMVYEQFVVRVFCRNGEKTAEGSQRHADCSDAGFCEAKKGESEVR